MLAAMESVPFDLDARGLEPPQPMIRILEALTGLPSGGELRARTDRNPVHLAAMLAERGFVGRTEPAADQGFLTTIRHAP